MKAKRITVLLISMLLVSLFVFTGLYKWFNMAEFTNQMLAQPLGPFLNRILVLIIPTSEIIIVLLLLFPKYRIYGLYASFLIMALFTGYVYLILTHVLSDKTPCSCAGIISTWTWKQHFYFNVTFLILAGFALFQERKIRTFEVGKY